MTKDLILNNKDLFKIFKSVVEEYNIGYEKLSNEMVEDGFKMDVKRLKRFCVKEVKEFITQKGYLWLLNRHGIVVSVGFSYKFTEFDDDKFRQSARDFAKQ